MNSTQPAQSQPRNQTASRAARRPDRSSDWETVSTSSTESSKQPTMPPKEPTKSSERPKTDLEKAFKDALKPNDNNTPHQNDLLTSEEYRNRCMAMCILLPGVAVYRQLRLTRPGVLALTIVLWILCWPLASVMAWTYVMLAPVVEVMPQPGEFDVENGRRLRGPR